MAEHTEETRVQDEQKCPEVNTDAPSQDASSPDVPTPEVPRPSLLPPDLAQHVLWRCGASTKTQRILSSSLSSKVTLPETMEREAQALMSQAFLSATQIKALPETAQAVEPNLVLYCPYADGQFVIDAMVEKLATKHEADVVVIDPLMLCSGKQGIFGDKVGTIFQGVLNNSKTAICTDKCSDCPQCLFDQLVNLPPPSPNDGEEAPQASSRRIIYFREINTITYFFRPLLQYLLRAIRRRRNPSNKPTDQVAPADIQPTMLVFAMPEDTWSERDIDDIARPGARFHPDFDYKRRTSSSITLDLPYHMATYFLPRVTTDLDYECLSYDTPEPDPDTILKAGQSCVKIIPEEHSASSFKSLLSRWASRRNQYIWHSWLALILEKRHASLVHADLSKSIQRLVNVSGSESSSASDSADKRKKPLGLISTLKQFSEKKSLPLYSLLDSVSRSAIGMASVDNTDPTETIQVTNEHLFRAFDLVESNHSIHSKWLEWIKKEKEKSETTKESDEDPDESDGEDLSNEDEKATSATSAEKDDKEKKEKENADKQEKEEEVKEDEIVKKVREAGDLTDHEKRLLPCIIDRRQLDTSFEDVCIPPYIIETLRSIVSMPLLYPQAFKSGVLRKEAIGGVLLYGPPGTGKTMVCRALAKECGSRMLAIKPSSVHDMWLGESEKLIASMFSLAKKLAPCIIFIDEIDALFKARACNDPSWRRNILNEIMQSMDGITTSKDNKKAGIVVVGATNRPYDLDDAILRRLPSRMLIGSPGEEQRAAILRSHLRDEALDPEIDIDALSKKTQFYTGSDLKNLCVSAAMASVRDLVKDLELAKQAPPSPPPSPPLSDNKDIPSDSTSESGAAGDSEDKTSEDKSKSEAKDDANNSKNADSKKPLDSESWPKRVIKLSHVEFALKEVPPSSSANSDCQLYTWHKTFGRTQA